MAAKPTAAELVARIRQGRARMDRSLEVIEDRVATIIETKDRVVRFTRLTAVVLGVVTITLATGLLIRALVRPRGRHRR